MEVARAGTDHDSWVSVALEAGVSSTTLDNWLYGRTKPRLRELAKVATTLGVSPLELEAAYEGLPPPRRTFEEALERHSDRLEDVSQRLETLVVLLSAALPGIVLEELEVQVEARRRAKRRSRAGQPSEDGGDSAE